LIIARGKFSPPRPEEANRDMHCLIFSLSMRDVSSLWNLLLFLLVLLAVPACKQPTAPDLKPEFTINTLIDTLCNEVYKHHLKGDILNTKIFSENQLIPKNVL